MSNGSAFAHVQQDLKPHLRSFVRDAVQQWNLESSRYEIWKDLDRVRFLLWKWLHEGDSYGRDYARLFGLVIDRAAAPPTVYRGKYGEPAIEVHDRQTTHGGRRVRRAQGRT